MIDFAFSFIAVRLMSSLGYLVSSSSVCAEMAFSLEADQAVSKINQTGVGKTDVRITEVAGELLAILQELKPQHV